MRVNTDGCRAVLYEGPRARGLGAAAAVLLKMDCQDGIAVQDGLPPAPEPYARHANGSAGIAEVDMWGPELQLVGPEIE